MLEILKEDFDDEFLNIQEKFQNAAFFAIDNEFSGILPCEKLSQFDSMDKRYLDLVKTMRNCVIVQTGISAFHFAKDTNTFKASTYCFYLFPQSFGSVDADFLCKTSSFEFLRRYKFDFNKLVYHGVPYLSHYEEKELRKGLKTGEFLKSLYDSLSYEEKRKIQQICSETSEKMATVISSRKKENLTSTDEQLNKETEDDEDFKIELSPLLAFVTSHEIHKRFPEIIIHPEPYGMRLKFDSTPEKSSKNYSFVENTFTEKMIHSLQGFTRVINLLIDMKKPIVGHNMISDLLMMLNQFHGPLPSTFQDFKREVHSLFPSVYDTKFLYKEMKRCHRNHFHKENGLDTSTLEALYDYFQDGFKFINCDIPRPNICQSVGVPATRMFHNAAWDSYCTGHIFIRLIHLSALLSKSIIYEGEVPTSEEYLSFSKKFSNRVNIISGNILYIVLDDVDPTPHRLSHLFVRSRNGAPLDIAKVARLCSEYGTIGIKQLDQFTALIGIGSRPGYRKTLKNVKNNPDFQIEPYSVFRHNQVFRVTLWMTFAFLSGFSAFLSFKLLSQMKK